MDLPDLESVGRGAVAAIASACELVPGADRLAQRIWATGTVFYDEAAGGTSMPDSRRLGRHLMYWLLRELAARLRDHGDEPVDPVPLQIIGVWLIVGLLSGWHPRAKAVTRVRAAVVRPEGAQARAWSAQARRLTLVHALKTAARIIEAAPANAVLLGLVVSDRPAEASEVASPWERFNRMFRRRGNNLRTLSSARAVHGTLGHGTLSKGGLAAAGAELLSGVEAGDETDLLVYLEALSHLPCDTVKEMPVVLRGEAPPDALAWIDLPRRMYCYRLFRLLERGAKPAREQLGRLEDSTQIVPIGLSDPAVVLLEKLAVNAGSDVVALATIVRNAGHHPRATVVGGAGYRVTSRRIQETLPALLLEQGEPRWPTLLATNSPYLVSAGRDSYGLCRGVAVDGCVGALHRAMGWPVPRGSQTAVLIGSRTVPKPEAVSETLNHLAAAADRGWRGLADSLSAIATLRACAPWVAAVLSLLLALRARLEYRLPGDGLRSGDRVRFNDKHLEGRDPVEVPICATLSHVISGWMDLARSAAAVLIDSAESEYRFLGRKILSVLDDPASLVTAFTIDAAGRPVAVGYRTWYDATPSRLRLPNNFGRQFWPLQLMDQGIEQRLLDVLMRHQLGSLDLKAQWGIQVPHKRFERLRAAMEHTAQGLCLRFPRHWGQP